MSSNSSCIIAFIFGLIPLGKVWTPLSSPCNGLNKYHYYTRMLQAILNKSWKQHHMKQQLYGYIAPISKIIQIRSTKHTCHHWRRKDECIRDNLLWTPTHGHASVGRPARTYLYPLWADTGCSLEDLWEWWMIGMDGEKDSRKSVLLTWYCDNDDDCSSSRIYLALNNL